MTCALNQSVRFWALASSALMSSSLCTAASIGNGVPGVPGRNSGKSVL